VGQKENPGQRIMGGKVLKKTLIFVCLLVFCNLTLFAQTVKSPRMIHGTEKSAIHVPPQEVPASLTRIYSNLGTSKTDLYNGTYGWAVTVKQSVAIPFTPKYDSHISQVRVAASHANGANQVNLSIYEGSGAVPQTLLAGPVTLTNLPQFGTCCTLAIASFSSLAVSGGTRYWVVMDTPPTGTGSDFEGSWNNVAKIVPVAFTFQQGGAWNAISADDLPAAAVLGTIP
jgi:hypothetical protein